MLIYAVILAGDIFLLYFIATNEPQGVGYLTLAVVAVVGLLLAHQVWMQFRDLRAPLTESEGVVQKKWSRAELLIVWHSYYVAVDRRVFRLQPEDHVMVEEDTYVKIVHFPRTLSVVSIEQVGASARPQAE